MLGRIKLNHGLRFTSSIFFGGGGGSGGGNMIRAMATQSGGPEFESTGARAILSYSINSRVSLIRALEALSCFS